LGGQIIARARRVRPFTLFGTVVMTFGVYLLTTLDTGSTTGTVALLLTVTGLGLGLIMPTATLAVQSTVDRRLLGVATSATQFIRSIGSTVGTAVVGSLVTSGYARDLRADAPQQAPGRLVSAPENPQAPVSEEARDALSRAVYGFPGGERALDGVLSAARGALSGAIHAGLVLILCTTAAAIAATLLMKNLKLEDRAAATPPDDAAPDTDSALAATLAVALEADATGDEDHALARFLRSAETSPSARPNPKEAAALRGVADRIESGNAGYPALIGAAADLSGCHDGDERERAAYASKTVIRPLAARGADDAR
jgi:hypothetical protein